MFSGFMKGKSEEKQLKTEVYQSKHLAEIMDSFD